MRPSFARIIASLSCMALFVPVLVSARVTDATTGLGATGRAAGLSTGCSGSASQCIAAMLGRIINIVFGFLGIVLLGYVLYGGFIWMTASDPKGVEQAKTTIRNAVVGVLIIGSSFAISGFVLRSVRDISGLTGTGAGSGPAGGAGAARDARLDQLMDGAARQCCYAGGTPVLACVTDCQANPVAFGLQAGATESACLTPCAPGARVCPGNPPTPVPGQLVCTPGQTQTAPVVPRTGQQAPSGGSTFRGTFCSVTLLGDMSRQQAACTECVNTCLAAICDGQLPTPDFRTFPVSLDTQQGVDAARASCRRVACGGGDGRPAACPL